MVTFDPSSEPYRLADFSGLDEGLDWRLDARRAALLVHDLLPYYLQVLDERLQADLVANATRLVLTAREAGVPVLASAPRPATRAEQRGLGGRLWGLGPSADQARTSALPVLADDVVWVAKRSLSAFYATDLEVELRRLGCDQLLVCGVFASAGIVATGFDALARDVEFLVVADAVADSSRSLHHQALRQVARTTGRAFGLHRALALLDH